MRGVDIAEMAAFAAIAERRSFTKAAAHLDTSPSALSQTIRALEDKLGARLLNRTTRSVAPTEIGEHLLGRLRPLLDAFGAMVESVNALRTLPSGQIRLTVPRPAGHRVIGPILGPFMNANPAINLEISIENAMVDIVKERFDAGIRLGDSVERDMIALRVGEEMPIAVVASPDYLARHARPKTPRDLRFHNCIRWRLASGAIHHWRFEKKGKRVDIGPQGTLTVNDADLVRRAALEGVGVGYLFRHEVAAEIRDGRLIALLKDWAPRPSSFYLYYPSRRQIPPPLKALAQFLSRAPAKSPRTKKEDASGSAASRRKSRSIKTPRIAEN
ncbi:MAG: LysR family transcriptional regulator [Rhodospirillaceae bacterium]|nr:LysR family transcriptional regulator [Rhodospirillaceae bacterium]